MLRYSRLGNEEQKIIPVRKMTKTALLIHYLHLCHGYYTEYLICIPNLLKCMTHAPGPCQKDDSERSECWGWQARWACLPAGSGLREPCPSVLGLKPWASNDVSVQVLWASLLKRQGCTADEITVSCWGSGPGLWVSRRLRVVREYFSCQLKRALKVQLY